MTAQDGTPSVDDDALASPAQTNPGQGEEDAGSTAAPGQASAREGRIRELIHQKQVADAVAARSAAEAAALRNGLQNPGRPQDYRSPEDYTRAIAEQAAREVGAGLLARQAAQAQEFAARAAQEAWSETAAGFRQRVPDFDAVAHNPNLSITPVMAGAIRESGKGAEIAYYLGKNPGEAAQIAALPPVSQATAIARIEGRLGANAVSVSRAPQPVATLSGRGGSAANRSKTWTSRNTAAPADFRNPQCQAPSSCPSPASSPQRHQLSASAASEEGSPAAPDSLSHGERVGEGAYLFSTRRPHPHGLNSPDPQHHRQGRPDAARQQPCRRENGLPRL